MALFLLLAITKLIGILLEKNNAIEDLRYVYSILYILFSYFGH